MKTIILAGGSGKRLAGIINIPKQFYILKNNLSSFMLAIQRALLHSDELVIIINQDYLTIAESQVRTIAPILYHKFIFIIEPVVNNTLSAIFLTLLYLKIKKLIHDQEKILIIPCDHIINNTQEYTKTINSIQNYQENLLLFGIKPSGINENYGHITYYHDNNPKFKKIKQFIEKPNEAIINGLGDYMWNSGLLYCQLDFILKILNRYLAEKYHFRLKKLIKVNLSLDKKIFLDNIDYIGLPNIPIDYAILCFIKLAKVYIVDFDWLDIGSPNNFIPMIDIDQIKGL